MNRTSFAVALLAIILMVVVVCALTLVPEPATTQVEFIDPSLV